MTTFSKSIMGKIKQECICPVPRWHFLLKSYVFWGLLALSLLLGSLSFSVIAHLVAVGDLDVFNYLHGNVLTSAVMMLPYFWILSLVIFALVAYYNWKHTRLGYRFKRRWIFVASIALSMFLGSILYTFGMGNAVDMVMVKAMPFYDQSKHAAHNELWLQPENGLIMGKITNIDNVEGQFIILDAKGTEWNIDGNEIKPAAGNVIKKGKIVKVIGKKSGERAIVAREIRKCGDCQDDEIVDVVVTKNANLDVAKSEKVSQPENVSGQ